MIDESRRNILEALYEESRTIKTYVDMIAEGNAIPYTFLITDSEMEDNQMIIQKVKEFWHKYELVFIGFQLKSDPALGELIKTEYKEKFDELKKILKIK